MTRRNSDPYALLGVTPAATPDEVTRAFRARLRALHPDTRSATANAAADDAELRHVLAAYVELRRRHGDRDRASEVRKSSLQPPSFRAGPVHRKA